MIGFSIVILTYNQRSTLSRLLAGLKEQIKNPKMFEVVITDDGSTDGTSEFVKGMRFPIFMKYLRAENNVGRSESRNRGFAKSAGKYVLFLDSDMAPAPGLIETYLRTWEKYPDDVIVGAIKNPPERKIDNLHKYLFSRGGLANKNEALLPGRYFVSGNFSIRKDIFEKLSGFDTTFQGWGGEDTDFGLRLEQEGIRIRYSPHAVCYHYHSKTVEETLEEFERYGRTGYRQLIEKHPEAVIFPAGWVFGLPDSRPGMAKKIVAALLSPLKSDIGISLLKFLTAGGAISNSYFDWLFYNRLARGFRKGVD